MRKNHLAALAVLSLIPLGALAVLGWAYLTKSDSPRYPAILAGAIATSQPSAVYHLIAEPRQHRGSLPGYRTLDPDQAPSRFISKSYYRFTVTGLNPLTGQPLADPIQLCDVFGHSPMEHGPAKLLCVTDAHLWLWNGQAASTTAGFEAYDRNTLKLAIPHEKIRTANPDLAKLFPTKSAEYKYLPALGGIAFFADDARYYVLNLSTLAITPVPEDAIAALYRSGRVTQGWSYSYPITHAVDPRWNYSFVSRIDLGDKIYTLQAPNTKPDFSPSPYSKDVMLLATSTWTKDQWGSPIPDATTTALGQTRYIKPTFLKIPSGDLTETRPILLSNTDALLLHRASTDRNAHYQLTRLHLPTGKEIWTTPLGLTELWSFAYTYDGATFVGDLLDNSSPHRPLATVTLPLDTGKPTTIPLPTTPPP